MTTPTMSEEVRLRGAPNFRDLGGYATADGRHVRRGLLFRSEGLHELTTEDYAALSDLGVRLICDLRSDRERSLKPTVWPQHLLPTTLVMDVNADMRAGNSTGFYDMLRDDPSEVGVLTLIMHIYRYIPVAMARHLGNFFTAATTDGQLPLILHCSAGKDRTGVLSALLLLILGVPRDTVIVDYMKTHEYRDAEKLEQKVLELMEPILGEAPPRKTIEIMAGVQAMYLDAAFEAIDTNYGSLDGYLTAAGVSKETLAEFRARLLE